MPIIQHLGTAFASGAGAGETLDPFGDGSCTRFYPLNDSATGNQDFSGNGYDFGSGSGESYTANGFVNGAWQGTGDNWMNCTNSNVVPYTNYSVSFWYKSGNTNQANKRLVTTRAAGHTAGWSNYNGALGFYKSSSTGYSTSVSRQFDYPDSWVNNNVWHHLVYTMSGSTHLCYLDAVQSGGSGNTGDGRSFNSDGYLALTCYNNSNGYNTIGLVDNLRIFNKVLSGSEVSQLYTLEGGT